MTAPHRYIENQFVRISRETQHRLPLITADKENELWHEIHYIFAREATRCKIVVLALSMTPFGYDAVIFDPEMKRSHFLKSINQCISNAVKRRVDHTDSLWSNAKPGNVPILDIESLKKTLVEVCIIPVKMGYVRTVEEWVLPIIGPADWGETLSFQDPRQAPEELKKRSSNHNPGILPLVNYATKTFNLKSGLISEIRGFENAERRRRKKVLRKNDCYKAGTFLNHDSRGKVHEVCLSAALCASSERLDRIAKTMKAFYLDYIEAFATFTWPIWSVFPCGTLKMREFYNVTCKPLDKDPFVFDPS